MKSSHWIVGAFGLGLAVAAVLFLVDARRSEFVITWRPGQLSTFIDPLYPPGRWEPASNGEQVMVEEPGYADIRIMKKYRTLGLRVKFNNPDKIPVQMGMRTKDGGMDLTPTKDGVFTSGLEIDSDGMFEGYFDIASLRNADGRAQMIISAPKLREGAKPITIREITVTYKK